MVPQGVISGRTLNYRMTDRAERELDAVEIIRIGTAGRESSYENSMVHGISLTPRARLIHLGPSDASSQAQGITRSRQGYFAPTSDSACRYEATRIT
jgi:hypothetical protein